MGNGAHSQSSGDISSDIRRVDSSCLQESKSLDDSGSGAGDVGRKRKSGRDVTHIREGADDTSVVSPSIGGEQFLTVVHNSKSGLLTGLGQELPLNALSGLRV